MIGEKMAKALDYDNKSYTMAALAEEVLKWFANSIF
jgi:hypothetical protein